ncbi:MAG TPA: hypothetical protein VKE22_21900 [Haliangiales bacterium]|nr:hypothetical protein [Haliangiales bacterium]
MRRFCLALGFLVPMPAGAAGLVVSPTVVTAEIAGDEPLPSVKIKNEGGEAWECELAVRPPAQALDGAPRPGLETYPYSAHTLVTIKNAHFVLQPGETATVAWRAAPPARAGGGYAVLAVKGRPAGGGGPWVELHVEVLLTFPGAARAAVSAGRVDAAQDKAGAPVTLSVRVKNEGDIAVSANAAVALSDASAKVVAQAVLGPAIILPGYERMIEGTLAAPPPGAYKIAGAVEAAGASVPVTGALEVLRPGEIATHRAALVGAGPDAAAAAAPVRLEAVVENRGNLPLPATGRAVVRGATGEVGATLAPPSPIPVGRRGTLAGIAPALPAGDYQVELWVENPAGRPLASARRTLRVGAEVPRGALRIVLAEDAAVTYRNVAGVAADAAGVVQFLDASATVVSQARLEARRVGAGETVTWRAALPPGTAAARALVDFGGAAPLEATADVHH